MSPDVSRLLIRAPNWVGDVVLSLGAVRDLRRNFPKARIEVLARPWVAELYEPVREVDGVIAATGFRADIDAIRGRFDAALLLPNSFGTALQLRLAGVPERWGYSTDGRGALLTRRARVPSGVRGHSEVYYYRAMLAALGFEVSASPDTSLHCPEAWRERAAGLLEPRTEGWIGLVPGASFGSAKRWSPRRYSAVGDRLARETGAAMVVLGSAAEAPVGQEIAAAMEAPCRVLCGETGLGELLGVLRGLRLLITNDSGPMHLAAALGVPLVAVFGPTDWRETAPRRGASRVVRQQVDCAPCKLRECPIDHRCMRGVTADRVIDEARGLLNEVEAA